MLEFQTFSKKLCNKFSLTVVTVDLIVSTLLDFVATCVKRIRAGIFTPAQELFSDIKLYIIEVEAAAKVGIKEGQRASEVGRKGQ